MQVSSGLVVGSHKLEELIVVSCHGDYSPKAWEHLNGQICYICGDEVGLTAEGELFVACNECAFPICRTCYEYERKEGNQVCPQCKTRLKRLKGSARVEGDEEEDDIDDLENEFNFERSNEQDMHHALAGNADLAAYGYGSVAWKERAETWKQEKEKLQLMKSDKGSQDIDSDGLDLPLMDEARQPLSRKLPIPSSRINPYRIMIVIRLVVLGFFFYYRVMHPVNDAYALWLVSVICELCFALSWILDQFPKWLPVNRETYLDRLSLRYEKEEQPSQLSAVDIFVTTVDPVKEPPLVTANTVLSILAVDYPVHKVSCYVSDDGASMLTFEALSETCEFARKWVPFCKKFNVEPRAPEWYFSEKMDYFKDKVLPSFVRERRAMKREYEEFKIRINALVAMSKKAPEEGWAMQDGTPWPGNNIRDHPGMIQILGQSGITQDTDGNDLPRLVYVSREKRPRFNHQKKAGAMNALVRVSAVLTNAPYLLNLDFDHYINNSKALREAMCFLMDPLQGKRVGYVQFPQSFNGINGHDQYANKNTVFFHINMKGLDGIQGPMYVGSGCVFRRKALYGYDAPKPEKPPTRTCNCWSNGCFGGFYLRRKKKKQHNQQPKIEMKTRYTKQGDVVQLPLMFTAIDSLEEGKEGKMFALSDLKLEKKFGGSPIFIASTLLEDGETFKGFKLASVLSEAIHVISCGYEDKTEWGKEVGWICGSVTEDILTGFKMHCHGWRSVYCIPARPAFKGSAPINISDHLQQVLRSALGSMEIFLSRHCPLWYGYGGGLKWLERISYINVTLSTWTSIPLVAYCTLPAVCLLTGKFIIPKLTMAGNLWFLSLFICIFATSILEMRWSGVSVNEWWRNEQFWLIGGVSAQLFAVFQGLFKVITGVDTNFIVTSKVRNNIGEFSELYELKLTTLLIPPTTLLIINMIGVVVGIANAINYGYDSWGPFFGMYFFAFWVIIHLYPFLKGLFGRESRTPTVIIVWSILAASVFSLLWVRLDPFLPKSDGLSLVECGLDCD